METVIVRLTAKLIMLRQWKDKVVKNWA